MIFGIGTDIIEIPRLEKAIGREGFLDRVYSAAEQAYCDGRGASRSASYAARWAAKEAVSKAIGTGIGAGPLSGIEILPGENGKPYVRLSEKWQRLLPDGAAVFISLSHAKSYAAAECVIEIKN